MPYKFRDLSLNKLGNLIKICFRQDSCSRSSLPLLHFFSSFPLLLSILVLFLHGIREGLILRLTCALSEKDRLQSLLSPMEIPLSQFVGTENKALQNAGLSIVVPAGTVMPIKTQSAFVRLTLKLFQLCSNNIQLHMHM